MSRRHLLRRQSRRVEFRFADLVFVRRAFAEKRAVGRLLMTSPASSGRQFAVRQSYFFFLATFFVFFAVFFTALLAVFAFFAVFAFLAFLAMLPS